MVNLIHEKYSTYYHANKMSTTFVFCFFIYFLTITVPFLIGFTSNQFWINASSYYEQPTIRSLNQYILTVQTIDNSFFYTNIPDILRTRSNSDDFPRIEMSEQSEDSSQEELAKPQNFTTKINLNQNGRDIRFVQLLLFFSFQLKEDVKLRMQAYGSVSLASEVGIGKALVIGQIELQQRHPIESGTMERVRYLYPPYYDEDGSILSDPIQIIEADLTRNETISLNCDLLLQPPLVSTQKSTIEIVLQVPKQQEIMFYHLLSLIKKRSQNSLLETLKFAWIQYFSLFIIFWVFGQGLLSFVIENNVYLTYKVNDLPLQQHSYTKKKLE